MTNANDSGAGSLRQAILDANAAEGADVIGFDPSAFDGEAEDINRLTSGELLITDALTITGGPAGVTITGDALGNDVTLAGGITDVAASLAADAMADGVDNDGDGEIDEAGENLLDDNTRIPHATAGDLTLIGLTLTGGRTTADFGRVVSREVV